MEIVPLDDLQEDEDTYAALDACALRPTPRSSQSGSTDHCPAEARHSSTQLDLCKQLTREYLVRDFRTTGKRRRPDRRKVDDCVEEETVDHFEQNRHVVLVLFLATSMLVVSKEDII